MRQPAALPLALALSLTVAVAAAAGCGNTGKIPCLRSNCDGCCDDSGECQRGDQLSACGARAEACATCAQNGACRSGACVAGDGGTAGPKDGGCGPANCNGCCDSNDFCRGGNTNQYCGLAGAACGPCPAGQACQANRCAAATCNGCVDQDGGCQPGNAPTACGRDAGTCAVCAGAQSCLLGQCTSTTCGSQNCNGCCDGTQCVTAGTSLKCGTGGSPCVACTSPAVCQGGACTTPTPPDAGSGGGCGPSNCNGCCQGSVCKAGTSSSACGEAGDACEVCVFFCIDALCFPI